MLYIRANVLFDVNGKCNSDKDLIELYLVKFVLTNDKTAFNTFILILSAMYRDDDVIVRDVQYEYALKIEVIVARSSLMRNKQFAMSK